MKQTFMKSFVEAKLLFARCLTLLVLALLSTNLAWGKTVTVTLDKLGASIGSVSNESVATVDITATGTSDKYTLNYLQGKKQGDAIFLIKSKGAFISNKTPIPGNIKSVTVYINSGASGSTTYHCAFSTTECTDAYTTGSTAVNITGGNSNKYTCSISNAKYFCVSLGNDNNGQVLKLQIEYDDGQGADPVLQSIAISGTPKTTYEAGEEFDITGLIVTGTYDTKDPEVITEGIEWTINPSGALTIGTTSVSVKATVDGKTDTKNYTVSVTPALPKITITKTSSGITGSYGSSTFTQNDVTFAYTQWCSSTDFIQAKASTSPSLQNTTAMPGKIKKIRVVTGSGKTARAVTVKAGTTSTISDMVSITSPTTSMDMVFDFGETNYTYFCLSTPSNVCYFEKIVISYEEDPDAVAKPTFTPAAGNYIEEQSVEIACNTEGASIYYTTDGTEPSAESTLYESAISVNHSMTIKAIAIKGDKQSSVATATYKITTYASLEELVADGDPGSTGYPVTVTLTNELIRGFYKSGEYTNGVYLNVPTSTGTKEIEIYCQNVPEDWQVNGTLSGTLESVTWKNYKDTWEICPDSWDGLTYTAPSKQNPTITATYKTSLKAGETDEYTVTYSGDGTLSITSSDTEVAEATIGTDGKVTITAKSAGTTIITISATETEAYYPVSKEYTLRVIAPASLPFAFDGGKSDVETTAGMSQTGLGSDYTSSSPKLKFDTGNDTDGRDNIVIWFNGQADYVSYDIKGNDFSGGTFDVMESADGNTYTSVASYTALGSTKETETNALKSTTRYVKFVYTKKDKGNVALGNIKIGETYPVSITNAKYATLGLPYAVEIPDGVSAYTATVSGSTVTMTKISGGVIPANCGVILYAETPATYTFTKTTDVNPIESNQLVAALGGYKCTEADEGLVYYLGTDNNGKATFKKLNKGGTIAAGKAYLKLDEALPAGAKLEVTFGEPTGITSYENDNENENFKAMTIYNLNGMRVNGSYKGIVIMNGKKYINK